MFLAQLPVWHSLISGCVTHGWPTRGPGGCSSAGWCHPSPETALEGRAACLDVPQPQIGMRFTDPFLCQTLLFHPRGLLGCSARGKAELWVLSPSSSLGGAVNHFQGDSEAQAQGVDCKSKQEPQNLLMQNPQMKQSRFLSQHQHPQMPAEHLASEDQPVHPARSFLQAERD